MGVLNISGRLLTVLLLAGNTLLLLLIVLSGGIDNRPINRLYWLEANTTAIDGAPDVSRWTFWGLCSKTDNRNTNCSLSPAYPLSPSENFKMSSGVPSDFTSNMDTYYYLSRFSFCFFWIALSFLGIGFLFYVFTWCSYSFTKVVFTLVLIGCMFDMAAVACQTAVIVMARNAFNEGNMSPKIGAAMMGLAWASVACSIITFFGTGISFIRRAWRAHKEYVEMQNYKEQALRYQNTKETAAMDQPVVYDTNPDLENASAIVGDELHHQPETHQSGVKFFKVRRNKKVADDDSI
ncbi:Sur7p Ecym_3165 [Eremothecium cymbalariae DBVPG|uniref:Protein SUR7 n=1 Tax=Eremothecium cymbalariae (strain CBS 270.75 / DBVPG 7215 / KCTC 17166 / NRRL Y-17582) TaxID=931890 RepID=G8JR98_ERECY|nr:Hypothetical protein Ecym_3165 [Eremothecium cymbalariae DBVPG\